LESVAVRLSDVVAQAPIINTIAPSIAIEKHGFTISRALMAGFMVSLYAPVADR
jgi:hypothetical protein